MKLGNPPGEGKQVHGSEGVCLKLHFEGQSLSMGWKQSALVIGCVSKLGVF